MNWLLRILEKNRVHFETGKPLAAWKPLYEAVENFMFASARPTSTAPHLRDPIDLKRYMMVVVIGLLPATLAGWYFNGLRVIALILLSYAVGAVIEVAFSIVRKEEINEGFLVTGLIFPLTLPPNIPFWIAAVGVAFGVLFGKELFGGTGRNLFNPALAGRAFIAIGYAKPMASGFITPPGDFPGNLFKWIDGSTTDAIASATPMMNAKGGNFESIHNLLFGLHPGSIGETMSIFIIAGGLFLLFTKVANWRTVAGILGTVFVFESIVHAISPASTAPGYWHLLAGGLLYGAFFMATDPVSSPITKGGKWIYGILIGAVTVLIRNYSGYVEGVMFGILFGNLVAPFLDDITLTLKMRRLGREA
ncbi:MAG TPA: RnfABCDGE type electron transport complex subunit D [Rectinemataceae bacterium]|nr:RnfABCDGE type electron transport complex subunit D [Rectinemataceae bacterium]